MTSRIAGIIELLSDGKWHRMEELRQQAGMDEYEVQEIAAFLSKYNFAMIDDANKKLKINKDFQKLLGQTTI